MAGRAARGVRPGDRQPAVPGPAAGRDLAATRGAGPARGERYGPDLARGYVDTASLFLVAACEMAAPTGRVALIMPLSFLAARDAAPARRRVLELATLEGLWICPDFVFPDAQVQVCAVILDRSGPRRRPVRRWVGERFDPIEPAQVDSDQLMDAPTWSHLAAPAFDIPEVDLPELGTLGELVSATAGFREQFYGLAPLVAEHPDGDTGHDGLAPLVTSGLIDPGSVAWGRRPARMGGITWARPAVDLTRLDPAAPLGRWVNQRRRPKLLVATQTKVIEAAPDPAGELIPSTPVIAAHVDGDDLWRALAVLLAPPVTAWARARYTGAALSATAIKLSARQVEGLPLPVDSNRWAAAADLLAAAHQQHGRLCLDDLRVAGEHMTAAYGCDPMITEWWANLL
ncbi:MAG: hypothetical protein U5K29_05220 [Acidimicrobiales bacterium]|nr:hypothetical protein [Acidimicrobiales bacterium]